MIKTLPKSLALRDWLSPEIVRAFARGDLSNLVQVEPFPHVCIPKFFHGPIFEFLMAKARGIAPATMEQHPQQYGFLVFNDADFLRFLYGAPFRSFLEQLMALALIPSSDYPYPQIHRFEPASTGLNLHTDWGSDRAVATLFYLNDAWQPAMGGELGLYRKTEDGFILDRRVAPCGNSFVAFRISPDSWHAVTPMVGEWDRVTLILDWAHRLRSERHPA